jgi:hypothetical protein
MLKTKGKNYFICYHCQIAFDIESCLMKDIDEMRWRKKDKFVRVRIIPTKQV